MLKTNTAVGIDQWSPIQLRLLSPEAKQLLLSILQDVESSKAWPGYTYYNIIVLMGKPAGGVRPIALMAMIYRLWTKIRRPYIVQWERAHAQEIVIGGAGLNCDVNMSSGPQGGLGLWPHSPPLPRGGSSQYR